MNPVSLSFRIDKLTFIWIYDERHANKKRKIIWNYFYESSTSYFILPIDLVLKGRGWDSGEIPTIFLSWITMVYSVSGSSSFNTKVDLPLTLIRKTETLVSWSPLSDSYDAGFSLKLLDSYFLAVCWLLPIWQSHFRCLFGLQYSPSRSLVLLGWYQLIRTPKVGPVLGNQLFLA